MADPEQLATVALSRAIRVGKVSDFDAWVERLDGSARSAAGYLASLRFGQTEGLQHLIFRFRTRDEAECWQAGEEYQRLASSADEFSVGLAQTHQGDPVRFELPSDASAAKWKRFAITWLSVFPILLLVSTVMRLLLKGIPAPVQLIPSSLILTATLQWIVLPRIQRWTRFWLMKDANGALRNG